MSQDPVDLPDPPPAPESRWLRNRLNWIVPTFWSLTILGLSADIELSNPVEVTSFSGVALIFMIGSVRFAPAGVRAERAGLRVRGVTRTQVVKWDDVIPPVTMERWRLLPAVPIVRTRQGARIPIIGLEHGNPMWPSSYRKAAEWLREINDAIGAWRPIQGASS